MLSGLPCGIEKMSVPTLKAWEPTEVGIPSADSSMLSRWELPVPVLAREPQKHATQEVSTQLFSCDAALAPFRGLSAKRLRPAVDGGCAHCKSADVIPT